MPAFLKGFLFDSATLAAFRGRIAGVYFSYSPASLFRFALENMEEVSLRRILNA